MGLNFYLTTHLVRRNNLILNIYNINIYDKLII